MDLTLDEKIEILQARVNRLREKAAKTEYYADVHLNITLVDIAWAEVQNVLQERKKL
jgi:hypothetical protein